MGGVEVVREESRDQDDVDHARIAKPAASILVQTSVDVESEYATSRTGTRSQQEERYTPGLTTAVTASPY